MEEKTMYRFKIMLFMGLVLLLTGCGSDKSDSTPEPENTESHLEATATQPAEQANAGDIIFRGRCASCHYLSDQDQVGPGLAGLFSRETLPDGQEFSEEALANFITQGGGAMPAVKLSADEIDELISYLKEATTP
jgi:mono/diheme cytochrome c family protein